ncbi:MAG: glycosyltransferase family 2 protein [Firmicutes bacterium]|nr:glycosyltransferase family 2 protein [Bacillota bacterium]
MGNSDSPEISVVIPNWNGKKLLHICLDSLKKQTFGNFETILVDNGSTDGSVEYVTENYPDVKIVRHSTNLGFAAGVNAGIRVAEGSIIVIFNNDAEASPEWLEVIDRKVSEHPEAGFFACRVVLYHKRDTLDSAGVQFFSDGRFILRGHFHPDDHEYRVEKEIFGIHGTAGIYRKEALDETGLFDEDFHSYMEESDLNIRLNLMGYRCLYIPEAVIYHIGSVTGMQASRDGTKFDKQKEEPVANQGDYGKKISDFIAFHTLRNRWFLIVKSFPPGLIIKNLPAMILLEVSQFIKWNLKERRPGVYFGAMMDFLKKLPKMLKKRSGIMKSRKITDDQLLALSEKTDFGTRLRELSGRL